MNCFIRGTNITLLGCTDLQFQIFHQPIDGIVIGKHPLMSKFMKGVYSMCPLEPKYFVMGCEPGLEFFENMSPQRKS